MLFNKTKQYNIKKIDKIIFVLNLMEANKVKKKKTRLKKSAI